MKGLIINGISDISMNKGVEFADYHEDPVKTEVSTEGIVDAQMKYRNHQGDNFLRRLDDDYVDCCAGPGRESRPIPYLKKVLSPEKTLWTFYLNTYHLGFSIINDFINKMLLVKESDAIMIHGPAALVIDDAEVLYSAIKRCKSKMIVMSSPYILNSAAAYLLTAANKIVNSPAGVIHMDSGYVGGCGKPTDARNGLQSEEFRITRILGVLKNNGFVTEEDIVHIMTNQGQVCKHGKVLSAIIEKYNEAHR